MNFTDINCRIYSSHSRFFENIIIKIHWNTEGTEKFQKVFLHLCFGHYDNIFGIYFRLKLNFIIFRKG